MKKALSIATIYLFSAGLCTAQMQSRPVNFATPNASNLGLYGSVPVNHFTGIPNISVPIHTIVEGDIKIPISLNYHVGSVKLNAHPGWTGLGWSLASGGAITRVVKGAPDELGLDPTPFGYYFNHDKLNQVDWHNDTNLKLYANAPGNDPGESYESQADEFHFNFLGFTGSFYLDHEGKWVVESDQNVKIEFNPGIGNGFGSFSDLRTDIRTSMPSGVQLKTDRYFHQFTIYTDDGTKYDFGGTDATEYSVPYRTPKTSILTATTWNLVKITSAKGHEVSFAYESDNLICSLANSYGFTDGSEDEFNWFVNVDPSCNATSWGFSRVPANGFLLFPVYLSEISTSNETVEFDRSTSNELRYQDFDIQPINPLDPEIYQYIHDYNDLQWKKLDEIRILRSNGELFKKYLLSYINPADPNADLNETRLKLYSLKEKNEDIEVGSIYNFKYNPNPMSGYCTERLDHWGFYNGSNTPPFEQTTVEGKIDGYYSSREPGSDLTEFYKHETLERITYPTGGLTEFEYEPHYYRKAVDEDRMSFTHNDGTNRLAGGRRIKNTKSYSNLGATPLVKEYYYVKGYSGQDPSTLASSGILNGLSQYKWFQFSGQDQQDAVFNYNLFTSSSLLPSIFNSRGSHVGYSEVVELTRGNGYKIYTYTNYDYDIHGNNHMDEPAINWIDYKRSRYSPGNSKEQERGKLTSITDYMESGNKVNESFFYYEQSSNDFVRSVFTEWLQVCASSQARFATAYKKYTYRYRLSQREYKVYEVSDPTKFVLSSTAYEYVSDALNIRKITMQSQAGNLSTEYSYATDQYGSGSPENPIAQTMTEMVNRNMIAAPVETINMKEIDGTDYVVDVTLNNYASYNSNKGSLMADKNILVSSVMKLDTDKPLYYNLTPISQSYGSYVVYGDGEIIDSKLKQGLANEYSLYGNLVQQIGIDDVSVFYLWGYKYKLPIAKVINARNGTYSEITNTEDIPKIPSFSTDGMGSSPDLPIYENIVISEKQNITIDVSKLYREDLEGGDLGDIYFTINSGLGHTSEHIFFDSKTPIQEGSRWYIDPDPVVISNVRPGTYGLEVIRSTDLLNLEGNFSYYETLVSTTITEYSTPQAFHTSFEEDINKVLESPTDPTDKAHTGKHYLLGSFDVSLADKVAGDYIITYWQNTGAGWELADEVSIAITESSTIHTIGGAGIKLDEVRLHPVDAQMTTYTYDPLIGMSSQTDPNNVTTYYEYDDFGRLEQVKDQDGNILNHYGYNYKNN